jgi:hypothetical protein
METVTEILSMGEEAYITEKGLQGTDSVTQMLRYAVKHIMSFPEGGAAEDAWEFLQLKLHRATASKRLQDVELKIVEKYGSSGSVLCDVI